MLTLKTIFSFDKHLDIRYFQFVMTEVAHLGADIGLLNGSGSDGSGLPASLVIRQLQCVLLVLSA